MAGADGPHDSLLIGFGIGVSAVRRAWLAFSVCASSLAFRPQYHHHSGSPGAMMTANLSWPSTSL